MPHDEARLSTVPIRTPWNCATDQLDEVASVELDLHTSQGRITGEVVSWRYETLTASVNTGVEEKKYSPRCSKVANSESQSFASSAVTPRFTA
jgi:hypothetical protein